MPAPDNTVEEVRASVLMYLRMYEEGRFTLSDLASELAVMAPAYSHALGSIEDPYRALLDCAQQYKVRSDADGALSQGELELAVTQFRRTEAAW